MDDELQELNLKIARELFGMDLEYVVGPGYAGYIDKRNLKLPFVNNENMSNWLVPDYCRHLVSAFLVVEAMRERWRTDDQEEEFWQFVDCQECGWRVDVMYSHHDGDICFASASDEKLETAICKAALMYSGFLPVDRKAIESVNNR
jgi:hypothetical protein